jgi:hypothetical protein
MEVGLSEADACEATVRLTPPADDASTRSAVQSATVVRQDGDLVTAGDAEALSAAAPALRLVLAVPLGAATACGVSLPEPARVPSP